MKWFSGDIALAVTTAKNRGAIFVVYCQGLLFYMILIVAK
jgi:hypothetical protein